MPCRAQTKALFEGILPYDPVEGSEAQVLGAFAEFAEKLLGVPASLGPAEDPEGMAAEPCWICWKMCLNPTRKRNGRAQFIRRILNELNQIEEDL